MLMNIRFLVLILLVGLAACKPEAEKVRTDDGPPVQNLTYEENGVALLLPKGWEMKKSTNTTGEVLAIVCNKQTGTPRARGTVTIRSANAMNIQDRFAQHKSDLQEEGANYNYRFLDGGAGKVNGVDYYYLTYSKVIVEKRRYIRERTFVKGGNLYELQLHADADEFNTLGDDIQFIFSGFGPGKN
jgi:hypothetical protein